MENSNPKGYNIIGDVAGNYETLLALLKKMPAGATPIAVGDMVDRGPKSREVLSFFMKNGMSVMGNHEHMMIDYIFGHKIGDGIYNLYDPRIWLYNGGDATIRSFNPGWSEADGVQPSFDESIMSWVKQLPLYIQLDGAIITHGPIRGDFKLEQCLHTDSGFTRAAYYAWVQANPGAKRYSADDSVIWSRGTPRRKFKERLGLQIHGHNSFREVQWYRDEKGPYAVCIDTCNGGKLTGIHWPSGELFEQEFLPGEGRYV